jgi:rieske iron-sulfur protein
MRPARPTDATADGADQPAVGRRSALKAAIAVSVGVSLSRSMALGQDDQAMLRPQAGDWLVKIGDAGLMPLAPEAIPVAAQQTMAWAMDPRSRIVRNGSRLNRVLLLRFDPDTLAADIRARAAGGVVAYTAICTHNGCEVTDWLGEDQTLSCPCHATKFDPKNGARVIDGPAPRPLPALPLALAEGRLVVSRPFTTRVGFEVA